MLLGRLKHFQKEMTANSNIFTALKNQKKLFTTSAKLKGFDREVQGGHPLIT